MSTVNTPRELLPKRTTCAMFVLIALRQTHENSGAPPLWRILPSNGKHLLMFTLNTSRQLLYKSTNRHMFVFIALYQTHTVQNLLLIETSRDRGYPPSSPFLKTARFSMPWVPDDARDQPEGTLRICEQRIWLLNKFHRTVVGDSEI